MNNGNKVSSPEAVARLCPQCGLCCNGALFADVKLQEGDDPVRLAELGIRLQRRGLRHRFPQPCAAFDGRFCRIYADRPAPCRKFECGLLRRVESGAITAETAVQCIGQALQAVGAVQALLRRLGFSPEDWALTRCYRRATAQRLDLAADDQAAEARGELLWAMHRLMDWLQRDFRR